MPAAPPAPRRLNLIMIAMLMMMVDGVGEAHRSRGGSNSWAQTAAAAEL